jgi:3alpha(or 20beta)-hydroxysteroid dehydrogenase
MRGRLEGKVAIVTGGARGQGEEEARRFVREGASVLLGDVLHDEGEAVAASIGDAALYQPLDVTDEEQWQAALSAAETRFGPVSVLVNNAGILDWAPIEKQDVERFRKVLDVNVVGTLLGMKSVAASMDRAGGGSIVNVSSTSGLWGLPMLGAYVASKWAVRGLTKTAAMDLGPKGIRVNSIHPGGVDTPMVAGAGDQNEAPYTKSLPVPRVGTVEDIANLVVYLASDESSFVTGAEIAIDGGATCGDRTIMMR